MAYTGFSPVPEFATHCSTVGIEFDLEGAEAALEALGMVGTNDDGFRELSNGDAIVLNNQFASQSTRQGTLSCICRTQAPQSTRWPYNMRVAKDYGK